MATSRTVSSAAPETFDNSEPITAEIVEPPRESIADLVARQAEIEHALIQHEALLRHQELMLSHQRRYGHDYYPQPRRRVCLPLFLFVATMASTFWAGVSGADPENMPLLTYWDDPLKLWEIACDGWHNGLTYMGAVMAILLAHEMGHFLQAVRYRIPASLPYFIPMPLTPLGTMGAVIGMHGSRADRREIFDIGISGPLAGLVVAIPIALYGLARGQLSETPMYLGDPLLFRLWIDWLHPALPAGTGIAWNPLYMAGWVGMLVTGLNMMPISQLDGGHVAYALFGRRAHLIARGLVLAAVIFILARDQYSWAVMLALVTYMGTDHPRTADDHVPLGWGRWALGLASLLIPVFCFVPIPIR
jgi:Zn-dependent protease